jgi:hypothetical protein
MLGTQISVKRLRSAGDSSFLPKSPPGFMVARMRKSGCARSSDVTAPAFEKQASATATRSVPRYLFGERESARGFQHRIESLQHRILCTAQQSVSRPVDNACINSRATNQPARFRRSQRYPPVAWRSAAAHLATGTEPVPVPALPWSPWRGSECIKSDRQDPTRTR